MLYNLLSMYNDCLEFLTVTSAPQLALDHLYSGLTKLIIKDHEGAVTDLRHALDSCELPENLYRQALLELALARINLNDFLQAEIDLTELSDLTPRSSADYGYIRFYRGITRLGLAKHSLVIDDLNAALRSEQLSEKDQAQALSMRGVAKFYQNDYVNAKLDLSRALESKILIDQEQEAAISYLAKVEEKIIKSKILNPLRSLSILRRIQSSTTTELGNSAFRLLNK